MLVLFVEAAFWDLAPNDKGKKIHAICNLILKEMSLTHRLTHPYRCIKPWTNHYICKKFQLKLQGVATLRRPVSGEKQTSSAWESGDFAGNRKTGEFFWGILQKEKAYQQTKLIRRIFQIFGGLKVRNSVAQTMFFRTETWNYISHCGQRGPTTRGWK